MPPHNKHTLKRFDSELETIRAHILEMGGLVEMQLQQALLALCMANTHLANQVIDQDQRVNQLEVKIDGLCCRTIACHQPTANDLRSIVTATKLIVQLERIGNEAKKIAHMAERRALQYRLVMTRFTDIRQVAESTQKLLQASLDSFARLNPDAARTVIMDTISLKEEFGTLFRHLVGYITENPRTISSSLDILFIAKAIERIADYITVMSELIIESSDRHAEAQAA
jgi:phosphate transport system protein